MKKRSMVLITALLISLAGIAYAGCSHFWTVLSKSSTRWETVDSTSCRAVIHAEYTCKSCGDVETRDTRQQKKDHNWETITRSNGSYKRCKRCGYSKR